MKEIVSLKEKVGGGVLVEGTHAGAAVHGGSEPLPETCHSVGRGR